MAPSPQCEPNNIELSIDEKDVAAAEPLLQLRTMDVRLLLSEKSAPSNYTNQQQGNLLPPISSLSSFNNNMLSTDPSIWALSHTHSPSPKRRCVDTNMSNTIMPAAQLLQLSKPKAKPLEPNTSLSGLNTLAVSASNVLPTGAISVPIHQMTAPVHQMTAPVPVHQMVVPVHQMAAPALPSYASSSQLHYKPVFYAQQPHPAHATMILHSSPYQHQHQYNQRLLTLPHHLSHVNTQAHPLVNQHYGVSPVQRPHPQLIAPALTGTTHILTSGLTEQSFGVMRRRSMYRPSRRLDLKCEFCGKSESPEWRRGPSGPNTLCNACGIKYAKKRKIVPEPAATTTASVVEAK